MGEDNTKGILRAHGMALREIEKNAEKAELSDDERTQMIRAIAEDSHMSEEILDALSDDHVVEWYKKIGKKHVPNIVSAGDLIEKQDTLRAQWHEES